MESTILQQNQNLQELQEQLERTKRELGILYEISNAMRTSLELNDVLYIILTGVTAHTGLGFNRAVLFLVNQNERCLEPKMALGPDSGEEAKKIWHYIEKSKQHFDDLIKKDIIEKNRTQSCLFQAIKNFKIPLDKDEKNLLAQAYHKATPMRIKKDKMCFFNEDPLLSIFQTKELVIVPLKAKDKVNGLIMADNIYTQKSITDEDLRIFIMLANQAGLAIENSRLYEIVIHKSHTDPITNLWNHRFFQEQLTKLIAEAQKNKKPISLIILDIDNFKNLNDEQGHQSGDMILKEIGFILNDSCRDSDLACRYGGEEFSIILPHTNEEQGYAIAERIRSRIEKHPFNISPHKQQLHTTVSVGIASLTGWIETKEDLIKAADKAMYQAKFGGKNQTHLAND